MKLLASEIREIHTLMSFSIERLCSFKDKDVLNAIGVMMEAMKNADIIDDLNLIKTGVSETYKLKDFN